MSFFFHSLFFIFLFNSCISFNLDSIKDKKADGIIFQTPPSYYEKTQKSEMDFSWTHKKNNNNLSFFSNCSAIISFLTLNQIQKEVSTELKKFKVIKQTPALHQNQEARYVHLREQGTQNSKASIDLFVFKKEDCFYVVSFFRPASTAQSSIADFNNFIKEFVAP